MIFVGLGVGIWVVVIVVLGGFGELWCIVGENGKLVVFNFDWDFVFICFLFIVLIVYGILVFVVVGIN